MGRLRAGRSAKVISVPVNTSTRAGMVPPSPAKAISPAGSASSTRGSSPTDGLEFLLNPVSEQMDLLVTRHSKAYYTLYARGRGRGGEDKFLLCAHKVPNQRKLRIFDDTRPPPGAKTMPGYLGRLKHNFLGSEFKLDDVTNGENRKAEHLRVNFGVASFMSASPRTMKATLTKARGTVLQAKQPEQTPQGYVLAFDIDSVSPSVKNFRLMNGSEMVMEMGKKAKTSGGAGTPDVFELRVRGPMSPYMAFGCALSSLQDKKVCA